MKLLNTLALLIILASISGCSSTGDSNENMIVGESSWEEWRNQIGGENYSYEPDQDIISEIRNEIRYKNVKFVLFAGSWCPDSRIQVPKIFKVLHELNIREDRIKFLEVDRQKEDGEGIASGFGITHVPTLIVIINGEEKGRIVEYPSESIEKDILEFVRDQS